MHTIEFYSENGTLTLALKGRIDSASAAAVESEMEEAIAAHPGERILLDAEKLEYISSAGLRVLLRLAKRCRQVEMINASPAVYEILEVTGFVEIIPTQKALRRISVEGCEIIGQGANGTVYRIDPETIVKVSRGWDSLEDIQRERELSRLAFVSGIPTAISYDVVKVGELYGSVFELLNAQPYDKLLRDDPGRLEELARISVSLLKTIHATETKPGALPDRRQEVLDWEADLSPRLPPEAVARFNDLVAAIPETRTMLHGDFHVKNIMMQNGESLLIDMDTLCAGHPIFELAAMYNAYVGYGEYDRAGVTEFLKLPWEVAVGFWRRSLALYLDEPPEEKLREVEQKARLIGAARIIRHYVRRAAPNPSEAQREKEDYYVRTFLELLQQTDSLVF